MREPVRAEEKIFASISVDLRPCCRNVRLSRVVKRLSQARELMKAVSLKMTDLSGSYESYVGHNISDEIVCDEVATSD